jgi:hypothetical protein
MLDAPCLIMSRLSVCIFILLFHSSRVCVCVLRVVVLQDALVEGFDAGRTAVESLLDEHTDIANNGTAVDRTVYGYEQALRWGMGAVAALIAAPALLLLLGSVTKMSIWLRIAAYTYVILLPLAVVISGVEYTASVGVSDFCVEPNAATLHFLNAHLDSSSQAASNYYIKVRFCTLTVTTTTAPSPA